MIDTPPAAPSWLTETLRAADLALIPVRPSPDDLRAVGATIAALGAAGVSYVPPWPDLAVELMAGLMRLANHRPASLDVLVHAAVVSFAFVFIHPFMDGNGRLSRYLIHREREIKFILRQLRDARALIQAYAKESSHSFLTAILDLDERAT